jgi:PadR family transcriptional regulator, regulatory protein PadR
MDPRVTRLPVLSSKESMILELLVGAKEMYGLELVAASAGGLKRGTVYVTLGRMEDKGYLISRFEGAPPAKGGLPRRIYAPTALGREALGAWVTAADHFRVRFAR